ncbi:hypothetical protein ANTPLA_LOCUS8433 [Anthophora plagiata]
MLIEALRNGVRRTAKPRLLYGRRVSTSSTKNRSTTYPLLVSSWWTSNARRRKLLVESCVQCAVSYRPCDQPQRSVVGGKRETGRNVEADERKDDGATTSNSRETRVRFLLTSQHDDNNEDDDEDEDEDDDEVYDVGGRGRI